MTCEKTISEKTGIILSVSSYVCVVGRQRISGHPNDHLDDSTDKKPNLCIRRDEHRFNKDVSANRVMAENVFGRMKSLCNITKNCYRCNEAEYDMYIGICVSLTNYHKILHPLRNEDGDKYRGWLKIIYHEAVARQEKRSIEKEHSEAKRRSSRRCRSEQVDRKNKPYDTRAKNPLHLVVSTAR